MSEQPPATLELVLYQLGELKQAQAQDRKHVDLRLDQMQGEMRASFASLTYVSMQTYERDRVADARIMASDRKVIDDFAGETRKIADQGRTVAIATLSFVILALGTILVLIKAVAG